MSYLITKCIKDYLESVIDNNNYSYFLSRKKMKGYRLIDKDNINYDDCDITEYLNFSDKFNNIVLEFNDKFMNNFPIEYSSLFNRNIKSLKIMDYKLDLMEKIKYFFYNSPVGAYDIFNNNIEIIKKTNDYEEIKKIINHELLHMASSMDLIFSGFSQESLTKRGVILIGNGLNEGYTEYLNKTYFSNYKKYSYHDLVNIAAMIERIVGKDFMIDCYFSKGLSPLIKRLGEITGDYSKSFDLILDIDNLLGRPNDIFNRDKYINVRVELANIYYKQLNEKLSNDLISKEQYEREKFLNVDVFLKTGITYGEDTIIGSSNIYIYMFDKYEVSQINKNEVNINFNLDLDEECKSLKK